MKRTNGGRIGWLVTLAALGSLSTGCIAVSRSTKAPAEHPPLARAIVQEWVCDEDSAFDLAVARADLRGRLDDRASDGWVLVDYEVGRIRGRTCLIASFQRPASG